MYMFETENRQGRHYRDENQKELKSYIKRNDAI